MSQKHTSKLVSFLGGMGYASIIMQWVWLAAVLLPWVMSLEIMQPHVPVVQPHVTTTNDFSIASFAFVIVITLAVIGLTVYIVSKLPGYVARESSKVVHGARDIVLPKVTAHQRMSKRRKIMLSSRILLGIKLSLSIIPFVGLYGSLATHPPLEERIVLIIGVFLLGWSLLYIITQRVVAHMKHVDYSASL